MRYFLNLEKSKIMNTEKKQWIAPQATEIEVNGGINPGLQESTLNGTIS